MSRKQVLNLCVGIAFFVKTTAMDAQETLWATKVLDFSTEKIDHSDSLQFRAIQILGKPSVYPQLAYSSCAWQPVGGGQGEDYIKVSFSKSIVPKTVAIVENFNPGGIIRIFGYSPEGEEVLLFENKERRPKAKGRFWNVSVESNGIAINTVKIVIDHKRIKGLKQFDAIAISEANEIKSEINYVPYIPESLEKENLGSTINSSFGEVAPVISQDGNTLFFTRIEHPENLYDKKDIKPIINQDVWFSKIDSEGHWEKAVNIGSPINNFANNAASAVVENDKALYLLNVYTPNSMRPGLSKTSFKNEKWTIPEEVKIDKFYALASLNVRGGMSYIKTEFAVSPDEKILLMALKRNEGFGENDLYVSFRKEDGSFSKPLNLGENINTASNEGSPFLSYDRTRLYFNSEGHPGYGSADIFVSRRLDDTWTNWSEPQNLGPDINSPVWDGFFCFPFAGDYAYFSTKDKTLGNEDIVKVKLPNSLKPKSVAYVKIKVQNQASQKFLEIKPSMSGNIDPLEMKDLIFYYDEVTMTYSGFIPLGGIYEFKYIADGYFELVDIIDLSKETKYMELDRIVTISPIK